MGRSGADHATGRKDGSRAQRNAECFAITGVGAAVQTKVTSNRRIEVGWTNSVNCETIHSPLQPNCSCRIDKAASSGAIRMSVIPSRGAVRRSALDVKARERAWPVASGLACRCVGRFV